MKTQLRNTLAQTTYNLNIIDTHLTKTTSNYRTDRNECPEGAFNTTFYIATQRRIDNLIRLHSDADSLTVLFGWIPKTDYHWLTAAAGNEQRTIAVGT